MDLSNLISCSPAMTCRRESPSQKWTQPAKDEDSEEDEEHEVKSEHSTPDDNLPRSDMSEGLEIKTGLNIEPLTPGDTKKKKKKKTKKHAKDDTSVATDENGNPIVETRARNPGVYRQMRELRTSGSGTVDNSHFDPSYGTFSHHLEQYGARSYGSRYIDNDSIPKPFRRRKKKFEKLEPQKKAEDIENYKGDRPIDELVSFINGSDESNKKANKTSSFLEESISKTEKLKKKKKDKNQKSTAASDTVLPTEKVTEKKEEEKEKGKNARTQPDNTDFDGKPSIPEDSENNRGKLKGTTALAPTLAEKKTMKSYRAPKDVCMYDGRLLKLGETDRKTLKSECKEENVIGSGGFGKVYASKTSIPGFDMRVAIKRVCAKGEHLEKAVKREMNASRILHPFILPLLAVFDEGHKRHTDYYIISPYCENNSLRMVIDKNPEKLSQFQRIRIGLQLALAIEYLHTRVENVRKAIFHKDISSKNVVLDVNMNARLMDFGLAREEDDCTSTGAGTEGYRHPKKGDGLCNMALLDYFAFGVVLRELLTDVKPTGITEELTGLAAPEKFRNRHLCNIESDNVLIYLDYKKLKWWPMDDNNTKDNAKVVNDVAAHCLKAIEVEWPKVIGELKNLVPEEVKDLNLVEKQCEVCMINSKGKSIQLYHSNCRRNMAVCVACEKNSFFNPITCLTCGESIQPIIGKDWGALLVAGDGIQSDVDQHSKEIEERVFKDDVAEIKRVITSRAPLIMGISPENVEEVLQDNNLLLPRLKEAFQRLKNREVTKMFIYVSCHGSNKNDNEFIFGSETLSLAEFQTLLDMLSNIKTFVIILDRCFPPEIRLKNAENVLQFNASKSSQASVYQKSSGSLFTRLFIKAIKGKSENVKCLLKTGSDNEECCLCSKFRSDEKDYLSVQGVFTYIRGHMENEKATPHIYVKGDLGYLGYFTDEEVRIEFTHERHDRQGILIQLEPKFFRTIDEVKTELLNQCKGKIANADSTVEIEMDTCRQDNPREVCNSIEMVMSAWAYRKPLYVKFYTSPL